MTIESVKNAVEYLNNKDNRMHDDDYLFYEKAMTIVIRAALKWCEYSVGKDEK